MKAILEFDLPREQHEFENAAQGGNYRATVQEIAEMLRQKVKYGPEAQHSAVTLAYDEIQGNLFEIANKNKVDVFD